MQINTIRRYAIFSLAILVFLGLVAFAQDSTQAPPQNAPASPRHMALDPAARLQHMAKYLNLTDDQKAKIQPILENEAQQLKALHADTSLTPDQRRAKALEIHQASRGQIEPILTPEQVAKLPKPGMGPGHRGMRGKGMDGGGRMAWMSQNLTLTDEQKAKIQPLFANQHTQVQAIRQDSSLTPEQKQAKITELRKSTRQQFLSILTPEQQQTLKQNMRERRGMHHGPGVVPSAPPDSQPTPPQSM